MKETNSTIDIRAAHAKFYLDDMALIYDRVDGKIDHPHRHDYYTVLFIEKAEGAHVVDYQRYDFGSCEVHFVSPGQVHQVALTSRPQGCVFTFSKEFLILNNIPDSFISNINLFRSFGDTPPLTLDKSSCERLKSIINDMSDYLELKFEYQMTALGALLQLFLINCNNSSTLDKAHIDEENAGVCIFRDFKKLVEDNYSKWHKVKDYASEINITPKHLSQTVKNISGKVAKDFIQERILLESKRLLLHTDLSIKEIAYETGFDEPLHFSGFFKKKAGSSPTQFRANAS